MDLSNLKPAAGATKKSKRLGRGQGSGLGGTATKGHKGQQSRSGYKRKLGFEGGQMPLQRRVPKFGFKNPNRVAYIVVNLDILQNLAEQKKLSTFNFDTYRDNGLVAKKSDLVKVLGRGELKSKLEVHAHKFSATAKTAIESTGGKTVELS